MHATVHLHGLEKPPAHTVFAKQLMYYALVEMGLNYSLG